MGQEQLRQKAFALQLQNRLEKSRNEKLQKLDSDDLEDLIWLLFDELALSLYKGYRVIFDGWGSFFTNPVKRKCYDTPEDTSFGAKNNRTSKWTFKRRVRFKPFDSFREQAEKEMTEEEYIIIRQQLDDLKEINRVKHSSQK